MHRHSFGKQPDKSTESKRKNSCSRLAGFKTWLYNAPATAAAAWAGTGQALAGRGWSLALLFCLLPSPFFSKQWLLRWASEMMLPTWFLLLDLCLQLHLHFNPYSVRWGAEWLPLYPAGRLVNRMSASVANVPVRLSACAASCPCLSQVFAGERPVSSFQGNFPCRLSLLSNPVN